MVVEEVRRQEEAERSAKAVSLVKQGQWMRWEGLERRKLSWRELWEMEASNISFIIRATYDVLPSPKTSTSGMGEDPICALCPTPVTLNISWPVVRPASYKADTPGGTTRSSRVWQQLLRARGIPPTPCPWEQPIPSRPQPSSERDRKAQSPPYQPEAGQLAMARDWKMLVTIGQQLIFPPEIAATTLRPDLVLLVPFIEVCLHHRAHSPMGEFQQKRPMSARKLHYIELAADAQQRGWKLKSIRCWSGM